LAVNAKGEAQTGSRSKAPRSVSAVVCRAIRRIAATSFRGPDGRPMSAADFIEKLFGDLPELFRDEDELRGLWRVPETRKRLLDELGERGYGEAQPATPTRSAPPSSASSGICIRGGF